MFTRIFPLFLISSACISVPVFTQVTDTAAYPAREIEKLQGQVEQLIKVFEYSVNTLGNKETPVKEKEVIIYESWEKLFRDREVQVEDDLDFDREVVVNKDIQAYLKDIDFFFRDVAFNYNIEEIKPQFNEQNDLYFIVTINRKLKGITVGKDTIDNNMMRYIEVNYNDLERDLRIASIYTTRLNEKEALKHWWNSMPQEWKSVLGKAYHICDTLTLEDVHAFTDTSIVRRYMGSVIHRIDTFLAYGTDTIRIRETDTMQQMVYDTLPFDPDRLVEIIKKVTEIQEIDIENNYAIHSLQPLSKLTRLRRLNCAGTMVHDLLPVRNLSGLEFLDCSHTLVEDLSMLRYSDNLLDLAISGTKIRDLSPVSNFTRLKLLYLQNTSVTDPGPVSFLPELEDLRFGETQIHDLEALRSLEKLKILDCSNTQITNLEPLKNLNNLERIFISNTGTQDLSPLGKLTALQIIHADNTEISSLEPLNGLTSLTKIYCDNSRITSREANRFMSKNPGALVIFESQTLQEWWQQIPSEWKRVFGGYIEVSYVPTKEQLHLIANLKEIDIAHNKRIRRLQPLEKLGELQKLNIAHTPVDDLEPLTDLINLKEIRAPHSKIRSVKPLGNLINLILIDISNTEVSTITKLSGLKNLREIRMDNTLVSMLYPLEDLPNLTLIYCENTRITSRQVLEFYGSKPRSLVVFQTDTLKDWWSTLSQSWKNIFLRAVSATEPLTREELHKVTNIRELDMNESRNIENFRPLPMLPRLTKFIANSLRITSLNPLSQLTSLEHLEIADNPVESLQPLSGLSSLRYLNLKNVPAEDLDPLENLTSMETLIIAGMPVKKLGFAEAMKNLKKLSLYNTRVRKLKELEELKELRLLECYNTRISERRIEKFRESHPQCEIIHY